MPSTTNEDHCQRCGEQGPDLRSLNMGCGYDLSELKIPFKESTFNNQYRLLVCKSCRASWMGAIENWFLTKEDTDTHTGTGVYLPYLGTNIEVTKEQLDVMTNPYKVASNE